MKTMGEKLVLEAIGDSYYPDQGQMVSAEVMINLINRDSIIAAAPEMLAVLERLDNYFSREGTADNQGVACDVSNIIRKVKGEIK